VPKSQIFAKPMGICIDHKDNMDKAISSRWLRYTRKINKSQAFLQTGKINHYVLQALVFLFIILILTIIGII